MKFSIWQSRPFAVRYCSGTSFWGRSSLRIRGLFFFFSAKRNGLYNIRRRESTCQQNIFFVTGGVVSSIGKDCRSKSWSLAQKIVDWKWRSKNLTLISILTQGRWAHTNTGKYLSQTMAQRQTWTLVTMNASLISIWISTQMWRQENL